MRGSRSWPRYRAARTGPSLARHTIVHEVLPVVHESFGGFNKVAADLLMYLAMRARRKTPAGEEPPWAARSFVPYHSQLISAAVQCEAAEEILDRVGYETDIRQGELNRSG